MDKYKYEASLETHNMQENGSAFNKKRKRSIRLAC